MNINVAYVWAIKSSKPCQNMRWGTGHKILFSQVARLFQCDQWSARLMCEALEIHLDLGSLNREDGV